MDNTNGALTKPPVVLMGKPVIKKSRPVKKATIIRSSGLLATVQQLKVRQKVREKEARSHRLMQELMKAAPKVMPKPLAQHKPSIVSVSKPPSSPLSPRNQKLLRAAGGEKAVKEAERQIRKRHELQPKQLFSPSTDLSI